MRDPRQILGLNITTAQMFPHLALFGAEGEGEGEGAGGEGGQAPTTDPPAPEPTTTEPAGGGGGAGQEPDPETFPKEYVEKLRRENAESRKKLEAKEKEEQERREAEMSEVDKAKAEAKRDQERADAAEAKYLSVLRTSRIEDMARELSFQDPADAHSLLDISELNTDDDGLPTKAAIKGALEKLAKAKPYLVKDAGSGDGGQTGPNPPTDKTDERTKELVGRGRVMIS